MSKWIKKEEVLKQIDCWLMTGEYKYSNATHYLDKRISSIKPKEHDWISVKDKLPEPHEDVLTVDSEGNIFISWLKEFGDAHFAYDARSNHGNITHWMPLPEPPISEDEDG